VVCKSRPKALPVQAVKACSSSRAIAPLILNLGASRGEWLTSRPGRFIPGKEPRYPLNKRVCGHQRRYGRFGENSIAPTETRNHDLVARSLVALSTALFRFSRCVCLS